MPSGLIRRFVVLGTLLVGMAPAAALEVAGRYGYMSEWTLEASLHEVSKSALGAREWRGSAVVKHTGLCTTNGNPEEIGQLTVRTAPLSRTVATLKVGSLECVYTGRLTERDQVFANCGNGTSIPMKLWQR
jgi:hypothetical protein